MKIKFAIFFAITAILSTVMWWDSSSVAHSREHNYPDAPNINIRAMDGREILLSSGENIILHFWASWCGTCKQEMPDIISYAQRSNKYKTVLVSIDRNPNHVKPYIVKHPNLYYVSDPNVDIARHLGTYKVPETYIIVDGKIRRKFIGPFDLRSVD